MITRLLKLPAALLRDAGLLAFPSFCRRCERFLDRPGEKIVCRKCLDGLRPWRGALCVRCGRFLHSTDARHLCLSCMIDPPPFRVHRSAGSYSGVLKDLILLFKYREYAVLSRVLAGFLHDGLRNDRDLWEHADVLIPVPLHPKRERERGFNQSGRIARDLSGETGLPVAEGRLIKTRNTPPQTKLEAGARTKNVRDAYRVKTVRGIFGKTVILVDDVCTTGSTLRACGEALLGAGVGEVRAVTLARTL